MFWLPFSFEAFEFNKQYLLFFLVSLGVFCWLAKQVLVDKEIRFRKTPLDIFVLVFLFLAILSAVFSVDKVSSFFGSYGRFSNGLIGLLSLGGLYFLITNNVENRGTTQSTTQSNAERHLSSVVSHQSLITVFSWSVFFIVLFSYVSIFGLWAKMNWALGGVFPQVLLQNTFNPASGSMEGLTIFLAAIIVLFTGLLLNNKARELKLKIQNILYFLLILGCLGILVIVDYNLAWIVLLIGLLAYLLSALITRMFRERVNRLLLPIFLIIIAVAFLFFDVGKTVTPQEYILDQKISWQTSFGSATEGVKSGFLGSGIGTYFYNFSKFKPVDFNQNPLWYINFDRPGSHFAEILGTMGFLGLLAYLFLIGIFLIISWFLLKTRTSSLQLPLLMTSLTLIVGQFFYYQNTVLAFSFWLMLALGASARPVKEKIISFKELPELSLIFSTLVIILGVAILGLYYFGVSYYLADVNYNKGLTLLDREGTEKLERAARLNSRSPQYRLTLSRVFLLEFFQEIQKPLQGQNLQEIQGLFNKSVGEAKMATDLQPNFVANWNNRGIIYREIVSRASGITEEDIKFLTEEGIKSFEKAAALEPNNPMIYTELANLHLVLGDEQKAKEYFQKAQESKSDYPNAVIQEALLLEKENISEAISRLENLITKDPWNIEAHYQLGRFYYNAGRIDEAIGLFEAVATVIPQHSNSLYSLGVAYAAKDQIQEAILVFERVLELNPGNQDVIQKLEELKRQGLPQEKIEQEELEEEKTEEEEEGEPIPSIDF